MSRIFVSYSHDSEDHRERVLVLARRLLAAGHHVVLDAFTAHPDPNWPQWMARELVAADVVLSICTPSYRARFEGSAPGGVAWEGHLISTELYLMNGRSGRFVPVQVGDPDAIPLALRGQPALPFDGDGVVAALGVVGEPVAEPEVHPGWTEAMSVGALVGPIWKPLRQPRADEGYVPTQLLRAEHAVVPFTGPRASIEELEAWCGEGGRRAIRVLVGRGGAGKTRLAYELCARMSRRGWRAGPLAAWKDADAPREYLDLLFRDRIPLLLVVDYAEARSEVLARLLDRLALAGEHTVRVLLVARAVGDWWRQLRTTVPDWRSFVGDGRIVEVEPPAHGQELVAAAATAFAARQGRLAPYVLPSVPATASPLECAMAALTAVFGDPTVDGMEVLLRHEARFLTQAGLVMGLPKTVCRLLPRFMALVTLADGLDAPAARDWTAHVDGLNDLSPADRQAVVELLGELYPRDHGGVDGVRPDVVGEALVLQEDPAGLLAARAIDAGRAESVAVVAVRATRLDGGTFALAALEARPVAALWIPASNMVELLHPSLVGALAERAVRLAAEDAQILLDDHLRHRDTAPALRDAVTERLWHLARDGDPFAAAKAIHERGLAFSRDQGTSRIEHLEVAIGRYEQLATPEATWLRARALVDLGIALGSAGRLVESIDRIEKGVRIFRTHPKTGSADMGHAICELGSAWMEAVRGHVLLDARFGVQTGVRCYQEALDVLDADVRVHSYWIRTYCTCLGNMALAYSDMLNSPQHALGYWNRAIPGLRMLDAADPLSYRRNYGGLIDSMSFDLLRVNRFEEALEAANQARELLLWVFEREGKTRASDVARCYYHASLAADFLGRKGEARDSVREGLEFARVHGVGGVVADCLREQAGRLAGAAP